MMNNMQKKWFQHNPMAIMSYLSLYRKKEPLYGSKIANAVGLSVGSVSEILRQLAAIGVVQINPVGRTMSCSVEDGHPLLKALRVFESQLTLEPLISDIKHNSRKIILFGSCAAGDDLIDSDIDLFILADDPYAIRKKVNDFSGEREINLVVVAPMELTLMETDDKVFLSEIRKGITLWEADREDL